MVNCVAAGPAVTAPDALSTLNVVTGVAAPLVIVNSLVAAFTLPVSVILLLNVLLPATANVPHSEVAEPPPP